MTRVDLRNALSVAIVLTCLFSVPAAASPGMRAFDISDLTLHPSRPYAGEEAVATCVVHNRGSVSTGPLTVTVTLGDARATRELPPLPPRAARTVSLPSTIETPGLHSLRCEAREAKDNGTHKSPTRPPGDVVVMEETRAWRAARAAPEVTWRVEPQDPGEDEPVFLVAKVANSTGRPVPGARLALEGTVNGTPVRQSLVTDKRGEARSKPIPSHREGAKLRLEFEGDDVHRGFQRGVNVPRAAYHERPAPRADVLLFIHLAPEDLEASDEAIAQVTVRDADKGVLLEGATVELEAGGGARPLRNTTDRQGTARFHLGKVEEGPLFLRAVFLTTSTHDRGWAHLEKDVPKAKRPNVVATSVEVASRPPMVGLETRVTCAYENRRPADVTTSFQVRLSGPAGREVVVAPPLSAHGKGQVEYTFKPALSQGLHEVSCEIDPHDLLDERAREPPLRALVEWFAFAKAVRMELRAETVPGPQGEVVLVARLLERDGAPLEGKRVEFGRSEADAPRHERLTNATGEARSEPFLVPPGGDAYEARFAGDGSHAAARSSWIQGASPGHVRGSTGRESQPAELRVEPATPTAGEPFHLWAMGADGAVNATILRDVRVAWRGALLPTTDGGAMARLVLEEPGVYEARLEGADARRLDFRLLPAPSAGKSQEGDKESSSNATATMTKEGGEGAGNGTTPEVAPLGSLEVYLGPGELFVGETFAIVVLPGHATRVEARLLRDGREVVAQRLRTEDGGGNWTGGLRIAEPGLHRIEIRIADARSKGEWLEVGVVEGMVHRTATATPPSPEGPDPTPPPTPLADVPWGASWTLLALAGGVVLRRRSRA